MAYRNEYEIKEIWDIFADEGVILPDDLASSMAINNRLESLLQNLEEICYENGRFDCDCESEDYWS